MRISVLLLAVLVAATLSACSKSSDNSQSSSGTATTASSSGCTSSSTSTTSGCTSASTQDKTGLPSYPGATVQGQGSTAGGAMGSASGKVMTTADSFDKVYKWYQEKMPKGSEKSHMTVAGNEMAAFVVGEAGKNQQTVTITAQGGKTTITMASVSH